MEPYSIEPPLNFTVRRAVRRYGPVLGNLRHIESNRPNRWAVVVSLPFVGFFAALAFIGSAMGNATHLSSVFVTAVMGGFYWWAVGLMGSDKVLVFDRGIVAGCFIPWHKQFVIPWESMYPETLRSYTKIRRIATAMGTGKRRTRRTVFWTQEGVGFLGPSYKSAQGAHPVTLKIGVIPEEQWILTAKKSPEALCRAIREAMLASGVPDAWNRTQQSWPPLEMTGKLEDTYWQVPGLADSAQRMLKFRNQQP